MTAHPPDVAPVPVSSRQALRAACVGNAVEWYDFAIFGALGVVITPVFFPAEDSTSVLLAAFAVYATAFLVRPVGAVVFGRLGDARGRQAVLASVVLVMAGATAAVGLLPGHARIGALAGVAVVLLRMLQGLAAGGELGVAGVFIVEHAPPHRRGGVGSWHTATQALGVALGLGVAGLLTRFLPVAQHPGWWRIAFLLALPLGLVGFYLRRGAFESPHFVDLVQQEGRIVRPVGVVWRDHRRAFRSGFALVGAGALAFNTFFVFVPNYLVATTTRTLPAALLAAVLGLVAGAAAALGLGRWSDRTGRRPVVLGCVAALAVCALPLMYAVNSGSMPALVLAEVVAGTAIGGALSMATITEMFPTAVRATGLAMTAGLASALLGGTAPLVDQILVTVTGFDLAPAMYVGGVALLALLALRTWPETAFSELG